MRVSGRSLALVLLLFLLGAVGWALWPAPTEEDRVRAVIAAVVEAAEEGDVGDVMVHVDPAYRADEAGFGLDADALRGALSLQFLRRGPVVVVLSPVDVEVTGDRAHARFDAAVAETGGWGDLVPVNADGWHLEVDFHRSDDGAWRVTRHIRSSWSREGLPGAPAP